MIRARYSKKDIRRAGKVLVDSDASQVDRQEAEEKVNYWREIHRQPLQRLLDDIRPLLTRFPDAVVAGRIKKLDTIVDKLRRPETPSKLDTMYDIAGCRIVLGNLGDLKALCKELTQLDGFNAGKSATRDYIANPRPGGYRCRHLIFTYEGPGGDYELSIELQVRTELQHAWATAVEMYDRAAQTRLKFNERISRVSDCFDYMSGIITRIEEGQQGLEMAAFNEELNSEMAHVQLVLQAACDANYLVVNSVSDPYGYCLVRLDYEIQTAKVEPIGEEKAVEAYLEAELDAGGTVDVLLLWGMSLEKIKKLYPNYFGDISMFMKLFSIVRQPSFDIEGIELGYVTL